MAATKTDFFLRSDKHCPQDPLIKGRLLDFMMQVGQAGLVNLAAGVPAPELLPVEALIEAFTVATQTVGQPMWAYQTPEGHLPLRNTIAERLILRGVKISGDEIVITTGCTQALHLTIQSLVGPGDVVACESPCYYNTLEQIAAAGAQALPLPMDMATGLIFSESEKLLKQYRPKLLVVCSSLSNPMGATIPEKDRPKWVELARRLNITIIEDDIYAELCEGVTPPPLRAYDDGSTVVYITSFCKTVSPGLRVGFTIPGKWFEAMIGRKCLADIHGSLVSEATLDAFLKSPDMKKHLETFKKICADKRVLARKTILASFPLGTVVSNPRGGFMLWVELPDKIDLQKLTEQTLQAGVSFAQGDVFGCGQVERSAMRINCARVTSEELVRGLVILGELIKGQIAET
jgi:DNA-binding transcriptional MocR family regulator